MRRSASAPCLSTGVAGWPLPYECDDAGFLAADAAARLDAEYAEWYHSQRPPDPRLPPPFTTPATAITARRAAQGGLSGWATPVGAGAGGGGAGQGDESAPSASESVPPSEPALSVGPSRGSSCAEADVGCASALPHHAPRAPPPEPLCQLQLSDTYSPGDPAGSPGRWPAGGPAATEAEPGWTSRGPCGTCGDPVLVAQERMRSDDGRYHHKHCREELELRTDPKSPFSRPFTKMEFVSLYGGTKEWEYAGKLKGEELRFDPASPGCRAYARWEFEQQYGGSADVRWEQAAGPTPLYSFCGDPAAAEAAPPVEVEPPPPPQSQQPQPPSQGGDLMPYIDNCTTVVIRRHPGEMLGVAFDAGLLLRGVAPDGAACRAGIDACVGMRLLGVSGRAVTHQAEALAALGSAEEVSLQFAPADLQPPPAPAPAPPAAVSYAPPPQPAECRVVPRVVEAAGQLFNGAYVVRHLPS